MFVSRPMVLPHGRELGLPPEILVESAADPLVLWLPGPRSQAGMDWQRIASVPRAAVSVEQGICAAPALLMPVRQHFQASLAVEGDTASEWTLPDGGTGRQSGPTQSDLLLVWSADSAAALDAHRLRSIWPSFRYMQPIGRSLFLIGRAAAESPPSAPPSCDLREPAEQALQSARQAGDPAGIALALADLGVVLLRKGHDLPRAVALLQESLEIIRFLNKPAWQVDVLGNLGLAVMVLGQGVQAHEIFTEELRLASELGDRFAEKLALGHLAQAAVALGDPVGARRCAEEALHLARQLGDHRDEPDLHWFVAIQHAELGQREEAVASADSAVRLMQEMGRPQAAWFAEHLQRYRTLADAALPAGSSIAFVGSPWSSALSPPAVVAGPSILKMALSATEALVAFIGSGFQTTSAATEAERLRTCASCPHHTGLRCRLCGCFTGAKARLPYERCPIGKWPE